MRLSDARVAVLAENNYQDLELWYPLLRLREAGAQVQVVGMSGVDSYRSEHGYPVRVDVVADAVSPADFDAVVVPGGYAPDLMRRRQPMLDLVRGVSEAGGIIAFICHAAWVPISAGIIRGKRVTSVSAIRDDIANAGGHWLDQEVVQDGNLISSRGPGDLPAFCRAIITALEQRTAAPGS